MAYSSPATVSDGNVAPASWGNSVKAGLDYLANPPACRVYHNTTQSLTNATLTSLAFNSKREDTDIMHDTVTNNSRITIKTAGRYVIVGQAGFAANATGHRQLALRMNGATYIASLTQQAITVAAIGNDMIVTTEWKFAANDYVELQAQQTSGGALNIMSSASYSPEFSAVWVGLG